jgi:hypothetical protein
VAAVTDGFSALRPCSAGMDEKAATVAGPAQRIEGADMFGPDGRCIALGLDEPQSAVDHHLSINAAIASVAMVSDDPETTTLQTFEQQFLKGERIHAS